MQIVLGIRGMVHEENHRPVTLVNLSILLSPYGFLHPVLPTLANLSIFLSSFGFLPPV